MLKVDNKTHDDCVSDGHRSSRSNNQAVQSFQQHSSTSERDFVSQKKKNLHKIAVEKGKKRRNTSVQKISLVLKHRVLDKLDAMERETRSRPTSFAQVKLLEAHFRCRISIQKAFLVRICELC